MGIEKKFDKLTTGKFENVALKSHLFVVSEKDIFCSHSLTECEAIQHKQ